MAIPKPGHTGSCNTGNKMAAIIKEFNIGVIFDKKTKWLAKNIIFTQFQIGVMFDQQNTMVAIRDCICRGLI